MTKFKAIYKRNDGRETVIKVCDKREDAVHECVNYTDNYCLDTKSDRIEALKTRNFYVLGCGPEEFIIEEVEK